MTSWKSQIGQGKYSLQFETEDKEKYKIVEKAAQMAVDGKVAFDIVQKIKYGFATTESEANAIRNFVSELLNEVVRKNNIYELCASKLVGEEYASGRNEAIASFMEIIEELSKKYTEGTNEN